MCSGSSGMFQSEMFGQTFCPRLEETIFLLRVLTGVCLDVSGLQK